LSAEGAEEPKRKKLGKAPRLTKRRESCRCQEKERASPPGPSQYPPEGSKNKESDRSGRGSNARFRCYVKSDALKEKK